MMRVILVVAAFLLAGCAASTPGDEPAMDLSSLTACDAIFPDGSQVDCAEDSTKDALASLPDGFFCTAQHETDETGGIERTWAHPDGRVAVSWDWPEDAMPGVPVVSLVLVEGEQVQVMDVRFGGRGAAVFPAAAQGTEAVIYTWMRYFTIESPVLEVSGARLHATAYDGDSWYTWAVPVDNGTAYFEIMEENDDPESSLRYFPSTTTMEDPVNVTMEDWTKGVRYKSGAAHVTGLRNRWCPDPLGAAPGVTGAVELHGVPR